MSKESSALTRQLALRDLEALYESVKKSAKSCNSVSAVERAASFSSCKFALLDPTVQSQHSWVDCAICPSDLRARLVLGLKRDSGVSLKRAAYTVCTLHFLEMCMEWLGCVVYCACFICVVLVMSLFVYDARRDGVVRKIDRWCSI